MQHVKSIPTSLYTKYLANQKQQQQNPVAGWVVGSSFTFFKPLSDLFNEINYFELTINLETLDISGWTVYRKGRNAFFRLGKMDNKGEPFAKWT